MNWVTIGWNNGSSSVRHQAITWTSAGLLSIGLLEKSVKFEFEFYDLHSGKCIWKRRLPKWQPFCHWGDELARVSLGVSINNDNLENGYVLEWKHFSDRISVNCEWDLNSQQGRWSRLGSQHLSRHDLNRELGPNFILGFKTSMLGSNVTGCWSLAKCLLYVVRDTILDATIAKSGFTNLAHDCFVDLCVHGARLDYNSSVSIPQCASPEYDNTRTATYSALAYLKHGNTCFSNKPLEFGSNRSKL